MKVLASQALAVLLQHPAVGSDQQIICKLLQICKAWRIAVQESAGGLTAISAKMSDDTNQLSVLAGLVAWLSSYPSLVRSVSIRKANPGATYYRKELALTARRLLEVGLQLAAVGGGTRARLTQAVACSASAAAAHNTLRLESYDSDLVATPAMLAAFEAATLTRLDLDGACTADNVGVLAHVKRLYNLKHLAITPYKEYTSVVESASVLAAIAPLRHLTSLTLSTYVDPASLQQLPVQLQQLTVHVQSGSIVIGHLTNLRQLDLDTDLTGTNSVLPAQLKRLTLDSTAEGPLDALGITKLQQLQYLAVTSPITDMAQLMSLTSMFWLEELRLENQAGFGVLRAAHVYPSLTMLQRLGVIKESKSSENLTQAARIAASASSITRLDLLLEHRPPSGFVAESDSDDDADGLHVCEQIKGLVCLCELNLQLEAIYSPNGPSGRGCLADFDALHLTALTGLTKISIEAVGGVDDTVACALATALKQLRHLTLAGGQLSTAPLPGLGCLMGLRHLDLPSYKSGVADVDLGFMSGLSRLTYLGGFESSSKAALDAFWAGIRSQHQ